MAKAARRLKLREAKLNISLEVKTELNNSPGRMMVSQAKGEMMKVAKLNRKAARLETAKMWAKLNK